MLSILCVLALLYLGRDILAPIALASILGLVVAPVLRALGKRGIRRFPAIATALLVAIACIAGAGALLVTQVASVAADLPEYQVGIRQKVEQVRAWAEWPFSHLATTIEAVAPSATQGGASSARPILSPGNTGPSHTPYFAFYETLSISPAHAWKPFGEAGLVLVLMVFILSEQESLQDRLIRLVGQSSISRTVRALSDAAYGVSRFFFCQFVVNICFGIVIGLGLWAIGIPHAMLWGTLSCLLRFVPYIGALSAGVVITSFAAAVEPGWNLALSSLVIFGALELLVAHWIEPKVYGRNTGISPLAVILSALFWGTLWGPIGLLISTPMTVCLVIAGRHVSSLRHLVTLFGRAPDVTGAERFFQRALSGDTSEILRDAAVRLRLASFARYCDLVLLPGLALAESELRLGVIDNEQQDHLRCTVAEIAETLAPSSDGVRKRRSDVRLDTNVGTHLRRLREARLGLWQGPLNVPERSIVLCAGLSSERDELVCELLARALRAEDVDARSVALPLPFIEFDGSKAALVSTVFLHCPLAADFGEWQRHCDALQSLLPNALLVTLRLPGDYGVVSGKANLAISGPELHTFEECVALISPTRVARGLD